MNRSGKECWVSETRKNMEGCGRWQNLYRNIRNGSEPTPCIGVLREQAKRGYFD